jgi:uncharacterized protein
VADLPEPVIRADGTGWLVSVKARPGARADRIRGEEAGLLLVDVAAAAQDGKATEHLLRYLAVRFGVPRRAVVLLSGEHVRWKRIRIEGGCPPASI